MKKIERSAAPTILTENIITKDNWFKYATEIREALAVDFDNKCGYCECELGVTSTPHVENFYPKSRYSTEISFAWENLLLACQKCNMIKRDRFPVDESNNPLLINPSIEDPSIHLKLDADTGIYEGISEKGKVTINTLNLNRNELVAHRKEQLLFQTLSEKYPQVQSVSNINQVFENFGASIKKIELVIETEYNNDEVEKLIVNMSYAGVITALETYLSDVFINAIMHNQAYLRKFVESYPKFKKSKGGSDENTMKFALSQVFEYHDKINEIVIKEILAIIYHNLRTIRPMFKDTFEVVFPDDLGDIYNAILIRHDIVHRNGRTKIDEVSKVSQEHNLSKQDITELITKVEIFVKDVNTQMSQI